MGIAFSQIPAKSKSYKASKYKWLQVYKNIHKDDFLDFESIGRGFESLRGHHWNYAFAGSAEVFLLDVSVNRILT